jgi:branched-chain amino acid transport system substrate-binding protein
VIFVIDTDQFPLTHESKIDILRFPERPEGRNNIGEEILTEEFWKKGVGIMKKGFVLIILVFVLLSLSTGVITLTHAQSPKGAPIRIGSWVALAGPGYQGGQDSKAALEIAVEKMNASGGLLGRPIEIVLRDHKGDVPTANRTAQELMIKEKVKVIMGGGSSAVDLAGSSVAEKYHIPLLLSNGNSETIVTQKGHDYVFLLGPNSGMESRGFAGYANKRGWKKFIALAPDYEWGQAQVNMFREKLKDLGVAVQVDPVWFKLGETEFSRYITQLQAAQVDAILIYAWGADMVSFTKQASQYGLFAKKTPIAGWWMLDALISLGKEAPEGVIGFERAPFSYLMDKYPLAKEFTNQFRKKTNAYPSGYGLMNYDCFLAWVKAVEKAGTDDPEKVAKALHGISFASTRGAISIREVDGQAAVPVYFGEVFFDQNLGIPTYRNANVVEVKPEDVWLAPTKVLELRQPSK